MTWVSMNSKGSQLKMSLWCVAGMRRPDTSFACPKSGLSQHKPTTLQGYFTQDRKSNIFFLEIELSSLCGSLNAASVFGAKSEMYGQYSELDICLATKAKYFAAAIHHALLRGGGGGTLSGGWVHFGPYLVDGWGGGKPKVSSSLNHFGAPIQLHAFFKGREVTEQLISRLLKLEAALVVGSSQLSSARTHVYKLLMLFSHADMHASWKK